MQSPKGNQIQKVTGDADAIGTRGYAIKTLGDTMQKAANTLALLADDKLGKGLSIDSLRETSNQVHDDLKKAGERYSPSGSVLIAYAQALTTAKSTLDAIVEDCEQLYSTATGKDGEVATAQSQPAPPDGSGDDPVATARAAAASAWKAFDERAADYDAPYETWEDAYDAAVRGLQDVNGDGVKDSFWDNIAPALEVIKLVLDIAGIVLLVLVLFVGGPIIGAIALAVAVLSVVVTVGLMMSGRAGWTDLSVAVVGIIPFAKVGKLASLAKVGRVSQEAAAGARFPRLSGAFNIVRSRNFTNTGQILKSVTKDAKTAWGDRPGTMHTWNQLTGGSKAIQWTSTALSRVDPTSFRLPTRSALLQRLTGIDDLANAGALERFAGVAAVLAAGGTTGYTLNEWFGKD